MPPIEKGMGVVLLRMVNGTPLLQVPAGQHEVTQTERRHPQRVVGLQKERDVLGLLGEAKELPS
jgi:hypothetical protein